MSIVIYQIKRERREKTLIFKIKKIDKKLSETVTGTEVGEIWTGIIESEE